MAFTDHTRIVDALLASVLAAGREQLGHRASGPVVARKADASPVTAADERSEAIILAAIARAMPGVAVVAEEAMSRGEAPSLGATFFLVDPIDGTREYIAGSDDFCINIALVEDARPVLGIIYAPAKRWLCVTAGERAAVEADVDAGARAARIGDLATRPLHTRRPQPDALVAIASRSDRDPRIETFLTALGVAERRSIGSALKFCVLARGEADVYPRFGRINEWDTAAGHAILAAAGGCVTAADGRDLAYGKASEGYRNPAFVAWGSRALVRPFDPG